MPTAIDHVVILVQNLDQGIAQYEQLGFTVMPGGKHARFTHNALITFHDGSYLELIAFYEQPDADSGETHRWFQRLQTGGGIVDYALAAPGLDALIADVESRGITTSGVTPGSRTRLDGEQLAWRSAIQQGDNIGALPSPDRRRDPSRAACARRSRQSPEPDTRHPFPGDRCQLRSAAAQRYQRAAECRCTSRYMTPRPRKRGRSLFMVGAHRIDIAAPTGAGDSRRRRSTGRSALTNVIHSSGRICSTST